MGMMYTLQPDESINDHVKESMSIINHIVELSIGCMHDLANPPEGTFVDMTYNKFMRSLEHIRESIQMLDELCDELEDDKDEIRQEYEEKVVQFFNRFMNADLTDETNYRAGELARLVHQLDNRVGELDQKLEQERERSNQLEEQITILVRERDLAKKLAKKTIDENHILKNELTRSELELKALREVLDKKYDEIESLTQQLIDTSPNNPCNFCGNCRHYAQVGKNDGDFEGICTQHYIKRVDPDDASCPYFESNQVDRDKPDHPCCEACNHDDCDDCTLCPF